MATIQVTLINGTTADADDVMDDFTEIYDNIDSSNVAAANKTGTGKFVLQTSPTLAGTVIGTYTLAGTLTITSPTITSPAISSPTITGSLVLNSGADLLIYSDVATTLKFQVDGATGNFGIPSGSQFFIDGTTLGGNTFIYESSADVMAFVVGGNLALAIDGTTNARFRNIAVAVDPTERLYYDGAANTYTVESSADVLDTVVGGNLALSIDGTTSARFRNIALAVDAGERIYLDGVVNNYIVLSAANTMDFVINGGTEMSITTTNVTLGTNSLILSSGNISVATNNKVLFDGSAGNTYILNEHPGVADVLDVYVDGSLQAQFGGSYGLSVVSSLSIDFATKDLTLQNAGTAGATGVAWVQVDVGGTAGYIRVFATV